MNDIARISMISCKQPKTFCECERAENRDDFRYMKFIYLHCCEEMILLKRVVDNRIYEKFRPVQELNRCRALPTEVTSQLFSGPIINCSFQKCSQLRGSLNIISLPQCKYMSFIYLKSSFITWIVHLDPTH